ncbi:MAG: hypothetical protein J6T56_00110 [Bacteroidales bacterium]|nr:hypothetical protein [Bacteroidales bacterium]MBP5396159.1 hypothetical protein [Bacteroidales bacterium]MBP5612936.1 hypothetical protein [Bacteroidales bacterium]MBR4340250.1 hypothetical protein [Bacteroidales bacterium]MBR6919822.1 hypothetical protein [Bacteroidales bacterium]
MAKQPEPDDWRRQGQETYLKGITLFHKSYHSQGKEWDHDHCEFCGEKFSETGDGLKDGYATADNYHWICNACFNDFKEEFGWK